MSARTVLKTKWIEFITSNKTKTLIKKSAFIRISYSTSDTDEFKLQFEEFMPPDTLFCPQRIKSHVMFTLKRSTATEFGVQVFLKLEIAD